MGEANFYYFTCLKEENFYFFPRGDAAVGTDKTKGKNKSHLHTIEGKSHKLCIYKLFLLRYKLLTTKNMLGAVRKSALVSRQQLRQQLLQQRHFGVTAAAGSKIIYTETDEAPMLATYSLLPVIQRFAKPMGIEVEKRDISVAGRLIAHFADRLEPHQRIPDELSYLGELAKTPAGNIIKLPNVSASIPQLVECIEELQGKGYKVPSYNPNPKTAEEKEIHSRFAKVLGSAVNPVLREGNSDRRAAPPVKENAKKMEKRSPAMRAWKENAQRTCVSSMADKDFFSSEQSHIMTKDGSVTISLKQADGTTTTLKKDHKLLKGEVIDATRMNAKALCEFFEKEISDCYEKKLMMSLHMKATANNGIGDVYDKIKGHPMEEEVKADILKQYKTRPGLAMVDSNNGITNLHVPSDVIIDASMPNVIRDGGQMWNKDDKLEEVKCLIPDRCYSTMYQACIEDCVENGQFDWTTMG